MGGSGSGRWDFYTKKDVVENCRSLDASRWMREGILVPQVWQQGGRVWTDAQTGKELSSIAYVVDTRATDGWLRLKYTMTTTRESLDYRVQLQTTRPYFGGLRWWFTCPLVVNGRACRRRVRKLYLKGSYFGCRICHDLTYRSAQEHDPRMTKYRKHPELLLELLNTPSGERSTSELLVALKATMPKW